MGDDLRARLAEEVHRVDWKPLAPHAKRSGLFLVDGALDLLSVAVAIARDDEGSVREWLSARKLRRPKDEEIEAWQDDERERFAAVIVQPYVLVQRDAEDA